MAKIKGIEIKGLREFKGRDWEGAQGNIYIDGVKAGWYNDAGNGGMVDIDLYLPTDKDGNARAMREARLNKAVEEYFKEHPLEGDYADLKPDAELFFSKLLCLMDDEKEYKKTAKKGYPCVVFYKEKENSPYERILGIPEGYKVEDALKKYNITKYRMYRSLDEFDIR